MDPHAAHRAEPLAAVGLVAAAVLLLIIIGATGASSDGAELTGLIALALGSALALDAWRRSSARARGLEAALRTAQAQAAREVGEREDAVRTANRELEALAERAAADNERQRAERERLQQALRRAEQAGAQQRTLIQRLEQSRRAEREWNRELRAQLQQLYDSPRRLAGHDDVRALVLEAAMKLVEAEKGILLSREDADGDGALDVALSHGFKHDPQESAVAQRFAHQVLALDEIVRDDTPASGVGGRSPADDEIDGLVAIPVYMRDRFHGVIICANRTGGFEDIDDDVLLALGDQAGAALHHGQLRNEVREAHHAAVRALVEAMSARAPEQHRETTGLAVHAVALARDLGFDDWQRDVLVCATLLRNVGYLAMPERLLDLPRPLRPDERAVIELHPRLGFNVIGQVPALRDVAATVLYHHERFDGAGYPAGLPGETIPKAARALAVLEAYGAMTADRPHRAKRSPEEACVELVAAAGTQFDPEITQLFVEEIRRGSGDVDAELAQAVVEALPLEALREVGGALGPLAGAWVDPMTLLANQRALAQDVREATGMSDRRFAMLLLQLEDLAQINGVAGYEAGDRLIQVAARRAQRIAARCGGTAYRFSGRRLAIVAPLGDGDVGDRLLDELRTEFAAGPSVRTTLCLLRPGERASDALERARRSLLDPA
jgi:HD-GYP domain-containing protein (c-di-GMP phosphodiesterase class II)/Skp family chaperone for outer membrane proteins